MKKTDTQKTKKCHAKIKNTVWLTILTRFIMIVSNFTYGQGLWIYEILHIGKSKELQKK